MADPFKSPKSCLNQGKKHISHLKRRLNTFFKKKPYIPVVELDSDGATQLYKFKFTKSIPDICTNYAADALSNLRAALDQTGFASAILDGHTNPKSAKFPFGDTIADVNNDVRRGCKNLRPEIVTLFESFQPYKGGNDLLWALNKLRNATHTALIPVVGAAAQMTVKNLGTIKGPFQMGAPVWDRTKNEIVYFRVGPGGKLQPNYNVNITVFVAFDSLHIMPAPPAIALLDAMASEVLRVIRATEAECRRLGLCK